MAQGTELATAYVSLVVESSKIPGQVDKSLASLPAKADSVGRSMGSSMANAIGTTFRTVGTGIGLLAGAAIGTAINKGFNRIVAIDDAKGKLAGLGHTAEGVAAILDNAKAAVDGTAFGLGEAATAAASAVAAGIKQGDDLTLYLKTVADAATIAGTSMGEMGYIFNKVQTSGKAYTADLNMLADRGIPIFQWLQEEYGKSGKAFSDMVADGKIDAETFRKVIAENIPEAAENSGNTLRGAYKNMQAALGRIGEAAMSPFIPMAKSALAVIRDWANQIKPHVAKAAQFVADGLGEMGRAFQSHGESVVGEASTWEIVGIKARDAADKLVTFSGRVRDAIKAFRTAENGNKISAFWEKLTGGAKSAGDTFRSLTREGSGFRSTMSKLADAGKSVGESLINLTGDAGTLVAASLRVLSSVMRTLADNADKAGWAITGLIAAYGVGKITQIAFQWSRVANAIMQPAVIAATMAQTRAVIAHNEAIRAYLAAKGIEIAQSPTTIRAKIAEAAARTKEAIATRAAASALTGYAAAQRLAAAGATPLVGAMRNTAAAAATMGARVQATAVTAVSGLGKAAGGLVSALGGPWSIALLAAVGGIIAYRSHTSKAATIQDAYSQAVLNSEKAQRKLQSALNDSNGELDSKAVQATSAFVEARLSGIQKVAEEGHSWLSSLKKEFNTNAWLRLGAPSPNLDTSFYDRTQRDIDASRLLSEALQQQRIDAEDLGKVIAEGGEPYNRLVTALNNTGSAGQYASGILRESRATFEAMRDAASNSTDGLGTINEAMKVLASTSADADDRVSALKKTLDALSGKPVDVQDALQSYNDSIRGVLNSTEEKWREDKGFGAELIGPDGLINTVTDNGSKLRDALIEIRDETANIAAAGGDLGPVFERNAEVFRELATATGLSEEQIVQLADSIGYVPSAISTAVSLEGATEVAQQLTAMKILMDNNREGVDIDSRLFGNAEVLAELQKTGAKITEIEGKPGVFRVEAPDIPNVMAEIDKLIAKEIPVKTVRVTVANEVGNTAWMDVPSSRRQPIPHRATGGSIIGAGGPTSDSIPAMLSHNEHVWTAAEVDAVGGHGAMRSLRQLALAGGFKFAKGGTPWGVEQAISKARSVEGRKYVWGGASDDVGFDCSGFVGWIQQILMGVVDPFKRLYTTYSLIDGVTAGLERGLGPAGTWFQVGVSQEHMAATLAGMAVESGGAHGTSGIGGSRAKATDGQFPFKFHLPNRLIAGAWESGAGFSGGKIVEWTDEDERSLQRAIIQADQARQKRDEIYNDPDSTANDKALADLDVRDADASVQSKLDQKSKQGTYEDGERITPEAPPLERDYTDEDSERIDKLAAVESAREQRNAVYDDPSSTAVDRAKADADYAKALRDAEKPEEDKEEKSPAKTIREVFTNAASDAAGAIFDGLKAQLPDRISGSHWWDVADEAISLANENKDKDKSGDQTTEEGESILDGIPFFDPDQILQQLGFTPKPGKEVPDWYEELKAGVYDTGGWLMPGQMAINLSNRPEPIFNSPEQLRQFAGSSLDAPASGVSREEFERALLARPNQTVNTDSVSQGMRAFRAENSRAVRSFKRR